MAQNGNKPPTLNQAQLATMSADLQKKELELRQREAELTSMEKIAANSTVELIQEFVGGKEIKRTVTNVTRPASVVAFDTDSKGLVKPTVKVYHEDPQQAYDIASKLAEQAKARAAQLSTKEA